MGSSQLAISIPPVKIRSSSALRFLKKLAIQRSVAFVTSCLT